MILWFSCKINGEVNIYRCIYGNNILLFYFNSLIGTFGLLLISISFENGFSCGFLGWLGQRTIVPLCIHQPLISILSLFFNIVCFTGMVSKIILLFLVLVLSYMIGIIIVRYFPFLVGKRRVSNE